MDLSRRDGAFVKGFSAELVAGAGVDRPGQEDLWHEKAGRSSRLPSGWWLLPSMALGAVIWLAIGRIVWLWL
ncbi:MAG: hypothetical protein JJU19_15615 [Pararhodobacter sp.]|nr:hypothetical protein [Pararhodobacter sp.]